MKPKKASVSRNSQGGMPSEPRSRTFTGCRTCRTRHLKCDEARPRCSTCLRLRIPCDGYTPSLLWMGTGQQKTAEERGKSFRYPLFDESERAIMSVELVQSLGVHSAGRVVTQLDGEDVDDEELHSIGPFGVFRALDKAMVGKDKDGHVLPCPESEPDSERQPHDEQEQELEHEQLPLSMQHAYGDVIQLPSEPWPLDVSFDLGQLPGPDLDSEIQDWMQLGACVGNGSPMSLSLDTFGMNFILSPRSGTPAVQEQHQQPPSSRKSTPPRLGQTNKDIEEIPRGVTITLDNLPTHTPLLLRYLKDSVLNSTPATSHRLSPWRVLFLPRALETFAEMSLWNTSSHTRRSILSSLLSKSAFHLSKSWSDSRDCETATKWRELASAHQKEAQEHLKSALATEFWGNDQAEYTEMLMAMLGVGFATLHVDGTPAVKKLLLDAERLIRLRGIPSNKAYPLRLLHHMYTHLRVIAESTSLQPMMMAQGRATPQRDSSLDEQTSPEYSPALVLQGFRLEESGLGDLDNTREKTVDVGYNDIHLDVSGYWQATLYPAMYGIPESLMTLLSQTISLVNEKPKLEVAALSSPAISVALATHTRTLEQHIWSWAPSSSEMPAGPSRPHSLVAADTPALDKPDARAMVLAVHQALIIFFYRRVYNMSAMIVQEQVRKTLDYLQPYVDMGDYDQDFAITIGWSCFIASCEAVTPDLQQKGLDFLQAMDGAGVFVESDRPSMIARSVWEQRSCSGDMTFSWPNVMLGS